MVKNSMLYNHIELGNYEERHDTGDGSVLSIFGDTDPSTVLFYHD